jgi:hypothetical protein
MSPAVRLSLHLRGRFFTDERGRTDVITFRNFHVRGINLTLNHVSIPVVKF